MNNDIFTYTRPEIPEDCTYLISPSMIGKFFEYPKVWYEEEYLGNKRKFQGNTSTYLGTICHYIYNCVAHNQPITRDFINTQLSNHLTINPNPDVNFEEITSLYPSITEVVVNQYILTHNNTSLLKTEIPVVGKVLNNIYIGGHCDRIEGDCVVDFKTVATKPNEKEIPFNYKIQLLSYVYALRQHGYEINRIRIVYGVRPTKTIPARCIVVTQELDYVTEKLMNDTLKLVAESVIAVKEHPELAYLIFKSMDLKVN